MSASRSSTLLYISKRFNLITQTPGIQDCDSLESSTHTMSNSTNSTDNNWQYLCTLQTCPLSDAQIGYVPSLAGNAFYVAIFALLLFAQIFLGIFYRTWGFLVATFMGIVLEVIGYIARIQMHFNPFLQNPFLMQVPASLVA